MIPTSVNTANRTKKHATLIPRINPYAPTAGAAVPGQGPTPAAIAVNAPATNALCEQTDAYEFSSHNHCYYLG